ncbi:hypothetical protein LCGC14_2580010, partial [marine sediment metagenome]
SLLAFDAATGKQAWRNTTGASAWSSPVAGTIQGKHTVVHHTGAMVFGLDPTSGKTLWEFDTFAAGLASRGKGSALSSTPIIVGDKLFVCSEPTDLLCLNLADGKILWKRSNTYEDVYTPAQIAEAKANAEKARPVADRRRKLRSESKTVAARLKKTPDDEALKAKAAELKTALAKVEAELDKLKGLAIPKAHKVTGYSTPTPVSDGKFVYVHTGYGTTACYDLDGKRQWIVKTDKPLHGWAGQCNSPVLAGGKLMVHVVDAVGLDAATGKEAWRTRGRWFDVFGSAIVVTVDRTELVFDPNGDVFRVSDGKRMAGRLWSHEFAGPIVEGGIVYAICDKGKVKALKLPAKLGEKLICEVLWTARIDKDRHYASPVIHEGLFYALTRASVLTVLDAYTGETVYVKKLDLGGKGKDEIYPSITLAGKYIYLSDRHGKTIVISPGREYKQVAVNTLEPFRSCPVFIGKRMYVRGL